MSIKKTMILAIFNRSVIVHPFQIFQYYVSISNIWKSVCYNVAKQNVMQKLQRFCVCVCERERARRGRKVRHQKKQEIKKSNITEKTSQHFISFLKVLNYKISNMDWVNLHAMNWLEGNCYYFKESCFTLYMFQKVTLYRT